MYVDVNKLSRIDLIDFYSLIYMLEMYVCNNEFQSYIFKRSIVS